MRDALSFPRTGQGDKDTDDLMHLNETTVPAALLGAADDCVEMSQGSPWAFELGMLLHARDLLQPN